MYSTAQEIIQYIRDAKKQTPVKVYVNGLCDSQVDVELLGGILNIQYQDGHIFMEGPARTVFEGIMNEEDFKNV